MTGAPFPPLQPWQQRIVDAFLKGERIVISRPSRQGYGIVRQTIERMRREGFLKQGLTQTP